jgi:hypothetical protein
MAGWTNLQQVAGCKPGSGLADVQCFSWSSPCNKSLRPLWRFRWRCVRRTIDGGVAIVECTCTVRTLHEPAHHRGTRPQQHRIRDDLSCENWRKLDPPVRVRAGTGTLQPGPASTQLQLPPAHAVIAWPRSSVLTSSGTLPLPPPTAWAGHSGSSLGINKISSSILFSSRVKSSASDCVSSLSYDLVVVDLYEEARTTPAFSFRLRIAL